MVDGKEVGGLFRPTSEPKLENPRPKKVGKGVGTQMVTEELTTTFEQNRTVYRLSQQHLRLTRLPTPLCQGNNNSTYA